MVRKGSPEEAFEDLALIMAIIKAGELKESVDVPTLA
jgi:hypothetical protein